jgi:drug/metabolite transporter (DMT)-like permease
MTFETMHVAWNLGFILGLGWLILFISIGAMSLLMVLIQRGDAGSVANLFYLVTPLVALQAWIIFDEQLTPVAFVGMAFCMSGVIITNYIHAPKQPDAVVLHP